MEKFFHSEYAPTNDEINATVCSWETFPSELNTVSFDGNKGYENKKLEIYPFGSFSLFTGHSTSSSISQKRKDDSAALVGARIVYSDEARRLKALSHVFAGRPLFCAAHLPYVEYRLPSSWSISHNIGSEQCSGKESKGNSHKNLLSSPSSYHEFVELNSSTGWIAYRVMHPYFQGRIQTNPFNKFSSSGNATLRVTPNLLLRASWKYEPFRAGIQRYMVGACYPLNKIFPSCPLLKENCGSLLGEVDSQKGISVHFRFPLPLHSVYAKENASEGLLMASRDRLVVGIQAATTRFVDHVLCYANLARKSTVSFMLSKEISNEVKVQIFSTWPAREKQSGSPTLSKKNSVAFLRPVVGIRFTSSVAPPLYSFPSLQ